MSLASDTEGLVLLRSYITITHDGLQGRRDISVGVVTRLSQGRPTHPSLPDLMLRVLDYIVTISFGRILYCG